MLSSWSKALFTEEPELRSQLILTVVATGMAFASGPLGIYAARLAGTAPHWAWAWALGSIAGMLGFYAAIRGGLTRRLADPAMTKAQMLFAITSGAMAYGLIGPMRGTTFPVLILILVFGLFSLSPRVVALIAAYAVVIFGIVMFTMAQRDPQVYVPEVEWGHFLILATMLPVVPLLALRFAAGRARQERQYRDLKLVRELASRDELTGLVNRRHMTDLLQRAQTAYGRSGRPYCVAVIDLDHFKQINDKYGHGIGDEVLRRIAKVSQAVIRDNDTLARWGGEEFVLLLGDSHLAAARAGVERMREHIASHVMTVGPHRLTLTMSAGIAEPLDGESFERALTRADQALYVAKARGRNEVVTA